MLNNLVSPVAAISKNMHAQKTMNELSSDDLQIQFDAMMSYKHITSTSQNDIVVSARGSCRRQEREGKRQHLSSHHIHEGTVR